MDVCRIEHFLHRGASSKAKYYMDIAPHYTEVDTLCGSYVSSTCMYCVHSQILNTACTVHLF